MDDIKLFSKTKKEGEALIETIRIYSQDIGMEVSMLITRSTKRKKAKGIDLPNRQHHSARTLWRKGTLAIFRSGHHQTSRDEEKSISDERKNFSKLSSAAGIPSKDKHLGCLPCKILGIILEMNERRTSTIGPRRGESS